MKLELKRIAKKDKYTIGHLYVDNKFFCDTLEDPDRGLTSTMNLTEIKAKKIKGDTAIPTGTYKITLDTFSPRFGNKSFYKKVCGGKLPKILNIKGFDGVLIHCGNTNLDTYGCSLVGRNLEVGKVLKSQETFEKLYRILKENKDNLTIKIL